MSATGEASLQSIDAAALNDSSRPPRSCTSRLSRGEKHHVSVCSIMFPLLAEGQSGRLGRHLYSRLTPHRQTTLTASPLVYLATLQRRDTACILRFHMSPSACGGSVGTTGEASLKSIDAALTNDSSRPLRSCTSRLSRGEKRPLPSHYSGLSRGEIPRSSR